jgi:micrococcal nuclease
MKVLLSRKQQKTLVALCVLLVVYLFGISPSVPKQSTIQEEAVVSRVVDGDTIAVVTGGTEVKVRLIGINEPESVDPRRPVECMGKEASGVLKDKLEGKNIRMESDPSQGTYDKYKRLLRYVYVGSSTVSVNEEMISEGYAYEYTYDEPYKYQTQFKEKEEKAKKENIGLWSTERCKSKNGV